MGNRLAVVVGIDSYVVDPLSYCAEDAEGISTVLSMEEYGFDVVTLLNDQATRHNILRALAEAREAGPQDFVFYFSGHGTVTELGAYLVAFDAQPYDEGIEVSQLGRILERQAETSTHVIAVLDCCHSGAATPWTELRSIRPSDIERAISAKSQSRVVLAACRPEQLSYEEEGLKHGVFTYHLLRGLMGEATDYDGQVTVGSLYDYVARPFEESTTQLPVMRGDVAGRVVLGKGFPPRAGRPLPEETAQRLVAEGKQYLDDYTSQLNMDYDEWRSKGHRAAAQALEPILRWFQNQLSTHRDLESYPAFKALFDSAVTRVAQLGSVDAGTRLSEGTLTNKLGEGGFGAVWRVDRPDGIPPLAYKIFHPSELSFGDKVGHFERGYRAMKRLDHPRIVRVYEYTNAPLGFYMDFIDGPNARDLPNLTEDPEALVRVLLLIAETIHHAHGRNVVHRDIKPENILLTYDQVNTTWLPYLTDFDLAWFTTATKLTKEGMGNVYYAAPEQLASPHSRAAHEVTVDVFSFGQLGFFTLTGSDPAPLGRADNVRALGTRLEHWPVGQAASRYLTWYERCTADQPAERYQDFQTLIDDLSKIELSLRETEPTSRLSRADFLGEMAFALSGFAGTPKNVEQVFPSLSGRTQIELRIGGERESGNELLLDMDMKLSLERITVEGVSNERARSIYNTRIDEILRSYSSVRRRPGTHGVFATHIQFASVASSLVGVDHVRQVLSRVIDAIER